MSRKKPSGPLTVVETLEDGTRILSNGFKLLPSVGTLPDGTEKNLIDMTPEEWKDWHDRLEKNFNACMNAFYREELRKKARGQDSIF